MKENGQGIDDKSVLLIVDFHKLGNTRRVSTSQITVNADKTMLRVNKSLFDSDEFDAIKTHDGKTRQWLYTRALPSFFKEGVFRVPHGLVVEVDEYLTKRATERAELVSKFIAVYPARVSEALDRLKDLANVNDYISANQAAAQFGLSWKYVSFATPDSLKNLKAGLFEREKQKIVKLVDDAATEIKTVLRVQMSALVKRMVTQLSPTVDGKRKKIYDTLTGNVEDFLNTFDARNIADDVELKALVDQARKAMSGVHPELLRSADGVRDEVKEGFEKIQKQLDKMIVDKPQRQFDFSAE